MVSPAVRKKYRDDYAAAGDDSDKIKKATVEFEARLFEDDGDPRTLRRAGRDPRVRGLEVCLDYVAYEIEAPALYEQVRDRAFFSYGEHLDAAEIGLEGASTDPAFVALAEEAALQILKALRFKRGLDGSGGECHPDVARGTSTPWLWFVSKVHALFGLPSVAEIAAVLESWSSTEDGVLAGLDFSGFEITDPAERAELEALAEIREVASVEAVAPRVLP